MTSGSAGQPAGPELFEVPDIADSTKRLVLLLLACGTCIEAQAQDLQAALRTCVAIESERDRLDCFDALARGTSDAVPVTRSPEPSPDVAPTNDFGIEHRASSHPSGETLSATLAVVESGGYGQLRVTLDNGQVWEQVGSDRYQLKVGDQVVIERGRFNSFFLRKQSSDKKVRFTRLN